MEFKLKNDDLSVSLNTQGGTLAAITGSDGTEYLWDGNTAYWTGQAPVLFPICGSIRNDKAEIGNSSRTQMPRHGIVRKREFKKEYVDHDTAQFSIRSNNELFEQFPYPFSLYTTYQLGGKTIKITYSVRNDGKIDMPYFIGGHPGFNCPLFPGESYDDYYLKFEKTENCSVPRPITETGLIDSEDRTAFLDGTDTLPLSHDLFKEDAVILDRLQSREVSLLSKNSGRGVKLSFEDFPYLILWSTNNNGPFIALEPWSGLSTCENESDVFEEKQGVSIVKPGETRSRSFEIEII